MMLSAPPDDAVRLARAAAEKIRDEGGFSDVSAVGVRVAEALTGWRGAALSEPMVRAMSAHPYAADTINGALFGGEHGRVWAQAERARLAALAEAARTDRSLGRLSERLNAADAKFRDRVEQVLAQAMRVALRQAIRKAEVRERKRTRTQTAGIADVWPSRRMTATVLAALDTDMSELLDDRFGDAADQVALLYGRRQAERRRALATAFPDIDYDLEAEQAPTESRRSDALKGFVVGAMFAEAARRLETDRTETSLFGQRGEVPIDVNTPTGIVADVARIANGAPVGPAGVEAVTNTSNDGTGPPTWDYTDDLTQQIVDRFAPTATVTYVWEVGAPSRPFEPHQDLAGMEATNESYWTVFAKDPGDWPEGEAWMPGDHDGCQCWLDVFYAEGADESVDADITTGE